NYGLSPVDNITASYGQGSSTTMLQLLQAYTAIFGNGEMVKPYFIDRIVDPNTNTVVYQGNRKVVSTPISKSTASQMQDLLRRVVADPEGTCRHYAAKTVEVMGKTGTGEIPLDGGYSENENIISCMLGFPYEDPEYMIYYAYISPMTLYYNYDIKPVPDMIDRIALLENLVINEEDLEQAEKYIHHYEMPNLNSFVTSDAKERLEELDMNVVVIGDGNSIVDQYPQEKQDIYTGQNVFLLTDGRNISLPDFTGWTRKDIIHYWNMSKLPITMDGYGVAYEQSVSANSIVDGSEEIIIRLREIKYTEPVVEEVPESDTEEGE
ncbi:MAG: hypothetical protein II529_02525, partial [Erysipelotrichaceae bacterium]|nr:hypothetical protein [Erysipelotrichaceae bacterium]